MTKIAIVVTSFPNVSETFILNQIKYLIDSGKEVSIFRFKKIEIPETKIHDIVFQYNLMECTNELDPHNFKSFSKSKFSRFHFAFKALLKSKTKIALLKTLNPFRYKRKAFNLFEFYQEYLYSRLSMFDIVHIHFANNIVPIINQISFANKKIFVSMHGYDIHDFDKEYYKKILPNKQIRYISNSLFLKRKAIKLGFPENQIERIPVGLDTSYFKDTVNDFDSKIYDLIFIGRLIELKGPQIFVEIINEIKNKGFPIKSIMIGDGPMFKSCQDLIDKFILNDHIDLIEGQKQKFIKDYLSKSKLFLLPGIIDRHGRCEAQGLVVQEAQAMKVPPIVSDVGGMKESIVNGLDGFIINSSNIKEYSTVIIDLLNNPKAIQDIGENARLKAVKYYDNKVIGKSILDYYGD